MTFWKRQDYRDGKQMSGFKRLRVVGGADFKGTAMRGLGLFCTVLSWCMHDSMNVKHRENFTEHKLK